MMTTPQVVGLLSGLVVLGLVLDLVRRRHLKLKYAVLWLGLGSGIGVLGLFPALLDRVAGWFGVADPPNLLFFVGLLVTLAVIVQLSFELSRTEHRVRTLAEELALLREQVDRRDEPRGREPGQS